MLLPLSFNLLRGESLEKKLVVTVTEILIGIRIALSGLRKQRTYVKNNSTYQSEGISKKLI